jgi:hypothetical protein
VTKHTNGTGNTPGHEENTMKAADLPTDYKGFSRRDVKDIGKEVYVRSQHLPENWDQLTDDQMRNHRRKTIKAAGRFMLARELTAPEVEQVANTIYLDWQTEAAGRGQDTGGIV